MRQADSHTISFDPTDNYWGARMSEKVFMVFDAGLDISTIYRHPTVVNAYDPRGYGARGGSFFASVYKGITQEDVWGTTTGDTGP